LQCEPEMYLVCKCLCFASRYSYEAHGCFDAILRVCVAASERIPRHQRHPRRWYDDSAKKGGDNLGFSGQALQRDKVVAFCDRHCNVIAPFIALAIKRIMLKEALPQVTRIAKQVGLDLNKTIVSLDGVYDSRANRKAIFNRDGTNIPENLRGRKTPKRGRSQFSLGHLSGTVSHHRASLRLGG